MLFSPPQESPQVRTRYRDRRRAPLLSPILVEALTELAAVERLSLATLIAVLINEALTRRLRSQP